MVNMLKVALAAIILLIIISIAVLGKKTTRLPIFKTAKTPSNESIMLEITTGLLTLGIALTHYLKNKPEATIMMWLGVLVFFAGGLIQIISRKQLYEEKTFEERLNSGFEAAQTGLYNKIRHPSKSALILMITGICLLTGSWWALGIMALLFLPSVLYRISQEERALLDKFGDRWLAYKDDSKKLIPGIF